MEALAERFDKTISDVENITELYDYAEKIYPYDNIRD